MYSAIEFYELKLKTGTVIHFDNIMNLKHQKVLMCLLFVWFRKMGSCPWRRILTCTRSERTERHCWTLRRKKTCLILIRYNITYVWDKRNVHRILAGKAVSKKSSHALIHEGRIILKLFLMKRGVSLSPWIERVKHVTAGGREGGIVNIELEPKQKHKTRNKLHNRQLLKEEFVPPSNYGVWFKFPRIGRAQIILSRRCNLPCLGWIKKNRENMSSNISVP